jgi:hypothetical protein
MHSTFIRSVLMLSCLLGVFPVSGLSATVTTGPDNQILVDGRAFFPIMTWLQNASRIQTEKTYGINTFVGQGDNSSALDYCNAAQAQGVYAVPSWNAGQAASVKTHPAMLGWVFGDEPDLQSNKVPPSVIRGQYDSIKAADPGHVAFLTTTSGFYSGDGLPAWMNGSDTMYYSYPKYTDVIGFDYYPVYGWCRPDWIYKVAGAQDELVKKYGGGTKSTYQWIECVRTSSQWCSLSSRGADDGPYDYEIKDEVWLAIVKGANAIGYFTHSWECPGYSQCCLSDAQIAMLKSVNAQLTALTDVLCAPDSKAAVTVQTDDSKGSVVVRVKEYGGSLYIIAADVINLAGAKDTLDATFTVPGLQGSVEVYGENRNVTPAGAAFTDRFIKTDPVHVYVATAAAGVLNQRADSRMPYSKARFFVSGESVRFDLPAGSFGRVGIYSCDGRLLRTLNVENGIATWHRDDEWGKRLSPGIYFAQVPHGTQTAVLEVPLYR